MSPLQLNLSDAQVVAKIRRHRAEELDVNDMQERDKMLLISELQNVLDELRCENTVLGLSVVQEELSTFRRRAIRLLVKLSRHYGVLPPALFVSGIVCTEKLDPHSRGGFADIFQGSLGDMIVAVKRLRTYVSDLDRIEIYQMLRREAILWRQLSHPHILPFLGIDSTTFAPLYAIVSPWMPNGNLLEYIQRYRPSTLRINNLLLDAAHGLQYLHELDVVHGDLRAANVLITETYQACLADFGFSRISDATSIMLNATTMPGNPRWLAPEFLMEQEQNATASSDIFSFGRVCLEAHTLKVPFWYIPKDVRVTAELMNGADVRRPAADESNHDAIGDELWEILQKCWDRKPINRPTAVLLVTMLQSLTLSDSTSWVDPDLEETEDGVRRPGWFEYTFAPTFEPTAAAAALNVASSSKRAPKRQRTSKALKDNDKNKSSFTIPPPRKSLKKQPSRMPCQNAKASCESIRDPSLSSGACQRCIKANLTCVPTPSAKARPFPEKYYSEQLQRKQVYIDFLITASQKIRGQIHPRDAPAPQNTALLSPLSPTGRRLSQEGRTIVTWLKDSSSGTVACDGSISPTNGAEERSPSVPDESVPLKLFSELALEGRHEVVAESATASPEQSRRTASNDDVVGILAPDYFRPSPSSNLIARQEPASKAIPPELLIHDLLTSLNIGELFHIYHTYLNSWVPLLDPYLHTATETYRRSPFLWSVVCAVTLRYYPPKAHLHSLAMHFTVNQAAQTLMQLESTMPSDNSRIVDRPKSVELVQAYVLLAIYPTHVRKWQEDRSWLYIGLALRIAVDLGVDQTKPDALKGEVKDREVLNRIRLWMILWSADWNMCAYGGKPYGAKQNRIMLNAPKFYHLSHYNLLHDMGLSAYSELLTLIGRFHSDVHSDPVAVGGLNSKLNLIGKALEADKELSSLHDHWKGVFAESQRSFLAGHEKVTYGFRALLWPFCVEYGRLWLLNFGFQQAFRNEKIVSDEAPMLVAKCLRAGREVLRVVNDQIIPSGFMAYSPDGYFLFVAYSASFLLKLLGPRYDAYLPVAEKQQIYTMVQTLVGHFSSKERFPDPRHTPRLYARFLARMLERYRSLLPSDGNAKQEERPAGYSAHYPPATLDFDFGKTDAMFDPVAQFNQDPYVFSALFPSFSSMS